MTIARTIAIEGASENGSTSAVGDMAEGSKSRTITGAIKGLFSGAAKTLTRPDEEEPAPPRRRSGDTEKGFGIAARNLVRRLVRTMILSPEEWGAPDAHRHSAFDTLAQINHELTGGDHDSQFDTIIYHIGPHL
jgi:hypothetical protein